MASPLAKKLKVMLLVSYAGIGTFCGYRLLYHDFKNNGLDVLSDRDRLIIWGAHSAFAFNVATFWNTYFEDNDEVKDLNEQIGLRKIIVGFGLFYAIPIILSYTAYSKYSKYLCGIVLVEKVFSSIDFIQRGSFKTASDYILAGDVVFGLCYGLITVQLFKTKK